MCARALGRWRWRTRPGPQTTCNVRKASLAEIVYAATGDKRQQMLRTQQNTVALRQELIASSKEPQDTVVDLLASTFCTAAALATMPGVQFRRFVGSELDQVCAEQSTICLARTLAPLARDGRFVAALKLSANKASAINKHATSKIPVAARRSGCG